MLTERALDLILASLDPFPPFNDDAKKIFNFF